MHGGFYAVQREWFQIYAVIFSWRKKSDVSGGFRSFIRIAKAGRGHGRAHVCVEGIRLFLPGIAFAGCRLCVPELLEVIIKAKIWRLHPAKNLR